MKMNLLRFTAFCLAFLSPALAFSATKNIKVDFGPNNNAKGDGVTDDRPAFSNAFRNVTRGDILAVPAGTYKLKLIKDSVLSVPAGVTVQGEGALSILSLVSDGAAEYREFLRSGGSDVTLQSLVIRRDADFSTVLMPLVGSTSVPNFSNFTIRNCSIVGNVTQSGAGVPYCHAFRVGDGMVTNIVIDGCSISACSFGLFENSTSTGTLNGITVRNSQFSRNFASDLEFNAPGGAANNVTVSGCTFADNQNAGGSTGWAVGFAHIQTGTVENCRIANYKGAGIHVEDGSSNVLISGNQLVNTAQASDYALIVLHDCDAVTIQANTIDARANTRAHYLIEATTGSTDPKYKVPTNVRVYGNTLLNGSSSWPWYLQPGSAPAAANDPQTVGNALLWEGELLKPAPANTTTVSETPFSNQTAQRLNAAKNDAFAYTLQKVPAGTYTVAVGIKKEAASGIFKLQINGLNQGSAQDAYSAADAYPQVNLGSKAFGGNVTDAAITITALDKNPMSSGYNLTFDYIELVAADQTLTRIAVNPAAATLSPGAS